MTTPNQPRLVLKGHDEIYLIDLNKVLYFLADDHVHTILQMGMDHVKE